YKAINPQGAKSKDFKRTGRKVIADTRLTGTALLGKELDTISAIRDHIKDVMEDRGTRESFKREADKFRYVYTVKGKYFQDNKKMREEVPPVDAHSLTGR